MIVHSKTPLSRVTTKEFQIGDGIEEFWPVSWKNMLGRFKLQKEMYSKGLPVARPIRIWREGKKIFWDEETVNGGPLYKIDPIKKGKMEEIKQYERIKTAYEEARGRIYDFLMKTNGIKSALKAGGVDISASNALWDSKKSKVIFTDLALYRREKKRNPSFRKRKQRL